MRKSRVISTNNNFLSMSISTFPFNINMQQPRISYACKYFDILGDMKNSRISFHKSINSSTPNTIFRVFHVVPCAFHRSEYDISPWEDDTALPATQYPDYLAVYSALDQIYRSTLPNHSANYPIAAMWNHGFMIKVVTKSEFSASRDANNPLSTRYNPIGSNWRRYPDQTLWDKILYCSTI